MANTWDRLYATKPVNRLAFRVSRKPSKDDSWQEAQGRPFGGFVTITQKEYDALNHLDAYISAMSIKPGTVLEKLIKEIENSRNKSGAK